MDKERSQVIYEQYSRLVFCVANSILGNQEEAEDVLSETFLQFFRQSEKKDIHSPKAYLCKTATRLAIEQAKARVEPYEENGIMDSFFDSSLLSEDILQAMEKLQEKDKKVVVLRCVCDLSYKEISKIIGGSPLSAQSRYRRAIAKLKEEMSGVLL